LAKDEAKGITIRITKHNKFVARCRFIHMEFVRRCAVVDKLLISDSSIRSCAK
jgi:hypothetical protein